MAPLGIALLGAGIFAIEAHVPAILSNPDVAVLLGVWSRSQKSAEALADAEVLAPYRRTITVYHGDSELDDLLASQEIGAVIVALPISKQPEIVEKALKAGKHVLSEKPVGPDVKSAKLLIQAYHELYEPKGLIWRVAENWAHEPAALLAAQLIKNGNGPLGPVLYYELRVTNHVKAGTKWHSTPWRTVPDYQGGFLLDGGVHDIALLRVALGDLKPTQIVGYANLHWTHLGPHDTIQGIATTPHAAVEPHGDPSHPLPENSLHGIGNSSPTGNIIISFGQPDLPEGTPAFLRITCTNGEVYITRGAKWTVTVKSRDPEAQALLPTPFEEKPTGVDEEVAQFARAALGLPGPDGTPETNKGTPDSALYDLAFIEALLSSNGKPVDLVKLNSLSEA